MALGITELILPIGAGVIIITLIFAPKILNNISNYLYSRKSEILDTGKEIKKTWSNAKKELKS